MADRSACRVRFRLPVELDPEADDARSQNRLNLVRVGRVLRAANRLNGVEVADVEDVERRHEPNSPDLYSTIDVQIEVLVIRKPAFANRIQNDEDGAAAIRARWAKDPRFERVALARVVEGRHVDTERRLIHTAQLEEVLGVHIHVADAAAGGQVVVLAALANDAVG